MPNTRTERALASGHVPDATELYHVKAMLAHPQIMRLGMCLALTTLGLRYGMDTAEHMRKHLPLISLVEDPKMNRIGFWWPKYEVLSRIQALREVYQPWLKEEEVANGK